MAHMARPASKRPRISIDVDPELRRRLRLAAAKHDLTIRAYVLQLIEERLHQDLSVEDFAPPLTGAADPSWQHCGTTTEMQPTIAVKRGDVVLVEFVFSEESGEKFRPAVVISSDAYHRARQEVIIAAITSTVTRRLFGDHVITGWRDAGLLYPSTVTGVVRTIKRGTIPRRLGTLEQADLDAYDRALRGSLALR